MTEASEPAVTSNTDQTQSTETGDSSQSLDALFSSFAMERSEHEKRYADLASSPHYARSLENAAAEYLADPEEFKPGDLVTWKAQLKNRRFPSYGRPAVVIETVAERKAEVEETARLTVHEPIELTLGVIDGDGDFMLYHFDRRRFTLWKKSLTE